MPIDSSPEGGEILHQPVTKPFPANTPDPHGQDPHGKKPVQDDGKEGDGKGLTRGPVAEPAISRPPLGN
jgi:hypothetical protein